MRFIHPTTNKFRGLVRRVLALWLLSVFSSTLMASLPGIEQEDGYIIICTAQGIQKIPLSSLGMPSDAEQKADTASMMTAANQVPVELDPSALNNLHGPQHCALCSFNTSSAADSSLALTSRDHFDFSLFIEPLSYLSVKAPKPSSIYSPVPQQRAPPFSVI